LFNTALAATQANAARQGALALMGHPAGRVSASPREGRGAGRPAIHDRRFYAAVAVAYDRYEHHPRREPRRSTRRHLAQKYQVPVSTIGKWLTVARALGFLTHTARGRRGSMATPSARSLTGR
jgi:hypothetical protein